ncbi:MAG: MFS transporter [Acidimicrobiales bacterium]|nr:MFS transporter [Acidimicrobiales bacterium]
MHVLRVRGFAPLLASEAINAIGNWIAVIAIWGFAAFAFDADAGDLALLFVVLSLPGAVLGPALGVVIDRIGPRRALIIANLGGVAAALALTQADSYAMVIVLALPLGLIEAMAAASLDALPPRLVDDEDLVTANALLGGAQDLAIVIGPILAAVVNVRWGLAGAFAADAVTFAVGFVVAWRLRLPAEADGRVAAAPAEGDIADAEAGATAGATSDEPTSAWRELREGFSIARRTDGVRWTLGVATVTYALWATFGVLEPLYVSEVLGADDTTFALLQTVFGVGLVLTGLALATFGDRIARPRYVALATIASGATAALYLGTESLVVAYVGVFLWGMDVAFFYVPAKTLLQRFTPARAHGRVLSLNQAIEPAAAIPITPLAALAVGLVGIQVVGVAAGVLAAVAGLVALRLARRLGPPPPAGPVDPTAGSSRDAVALGGQAPM